MTRRKTEPNAYLKYSGLAFQIFFLLLIGWLLGNQIDKYLQLEKPYFGLTLTVVFLVGFFYKLIHDLSKDQSQ